mmetsp:Transcript_18315/g.26004  ORF Transcript_18315/g.26004 Transcript_18315/m.26004 type:complete len:165 (+) Transcript_18315:307-801(+)
MAWRSRGRSPHEFFVYVMFAGFLAGFIFYLCVGNYQRAKKAMERQRRRRLELEEEKRALVYSPRGSMRPRNFNANVDSPRSGFSGTSSMYTDDKGLMTGVGGVDVPGHQSHMLLGGDNIGGAEFGVATQRASVPPPPPRDLLDDYEGGNNRNFNSNASQGEMSV